MPNIKTAISLDERLFHQIERLSDEMNLSRSKVISKAVQLLIERHRNQELLQRLNEVYAGGVDQDDKWLKSAKRKHAQTFSDKW
jgi:metal-responsive CopG/Arc/MetJ family transcriptional regulator